MKNKNQKSSNVHYFDQKRKTKKRNNNNKKIVKTKLMSIMTYCQNCKCQATKKNKMNDCYICDKCYNLTLSESYLKVNSGINEKTPQYVNWEDDLDYLYHHFWLDGDK